MTSLSKKTPKAIQLNNYVARKENNFGGKGNGSGIDFSLRKGRDEFSVSNPSHGKPRNLEPSLSRFQSQKNQKNVLLRQCTSETFQTPRFPGEHQ